MLITKELTKVYGQGEGETIAIKGVNLHIKEGEFVAVVGPSGSGKSTLLHILGGMDTSTSGEVEVNGRNITKLNDKELSRYRREDLGFVFQNYNLVEILNAKENILLPVKISKNDVDNNYIKDLVKTLGLTDRLNHYPSELSGGQQQRVAIGRALANKPKLILADEPTGNLDSKSSEKVMELLELLNKKYKQTIVMITHDNNIASKAHRKIVIKDGKVGG